MTKRRFNYEKPGDDFGYHKIGYSLFFILLGILIFVQSDNYGKLLGMLFIPLGVIPFLIKKSESYVDVDADRITFKNSAIGERFVEIEWNSIKSIHKKYVPGMPPSGLATNFYETGAMELHFYTVSDELIRVQNRFGRDFESSIKKVSKKRGIPLKIEKNR